MNEPTGENILRRVVIEVTYDPHERRDVDGDEWAYTLRVGGIDVESVRVVREECQFCGSTVGHQRWCGHGDGSGFGH